MKVILECFLLLSYKSVYIIKVEPYIIAKYDPLSFNS
jgi:hypothetical protein